MILQFITCVYTKALLLCNKINLVLYVSGPTRWVWRVWWWWHQKKEYQRRCGPKSARRHKWVTLCSHINSQELIYFCFWITWLIKSGPGSSCRLNYFFFFAKLHCLSIYLKCNFVLYEGKEESPVDMDTITLDPEEEVRRCFH